MDIFKREQKIDEALRRLGEPKMVSGRLRYICPCHSDTVPSLEMKLDHETGNILLICRACNATGRQVCNALGIKTSKLMGEGRKFEKNVTRARSVMEEWKECPGVPEEYERAMVHTYKNEFGEPQFDVVVYHNDKGEKQIRQRMHAREHGEVGSTGYVWGLDSRLPRILYNEDWLARARRPRLLSDDRPVFIVEGEKCADAMMEHKMLSTTNPGGANKFAKVSEDSLRHLRGCDIIVIPDNDAIGYEHACAVAEICCQYAISVRVWDWKQVDLPSKSGLKEWPNKYDIYDWLHGLKGAKTFWKSKAEAKRWILNHAASCKLWKPTTPSPLGSATKPQKNNSMGVATPSTFSFSDIETHAVKWLWHDRIPAGRLTIWGGQPGVGKSYVSMYVAAHISSGQPFVDGKACEHGNVLIMAAEDDPADTIAPRLRKFGADMSRIRGLDEHLYLDRDNARICAMIKRDNLKLVVVDPVNAFVDEETTNIYSDPSVRKILTPLKDACERAGCTMLFVTHFNKGQGIGTERFSGSGAWAAACRVAFVLGKHPDNLCDTDSTAVFAPVKFNIGEMPTSLSYRISDSGLEWLGEDSSVDAASVLSHISVPREVREMRRLAIALVAGLLSRQEDQCASANYILRACGEQGIERPTAHWAANYLGVIKAPREFGGKFFWTLPRHIEESRDVDRQRRVELAVESSQLEIKDMLKHYVEQEDFA